MTIPSKERIIEYLRKNGPSKASRIAYHFGCERKDINRILYYTLEPEGLVEKSYSSTWRIGNPPVPIDDLFAKLISIISNYRDFKAEIDIEENNDNIAVQSTSPVRTQTHLPPSGAEQPLESVPPANPAEESRVIGQASLNAIKMLEFLEQWAQSLNKPLFDVRKDSRIQFSLTQSETIEIPGLSLGEQGPTGAAWLRLERPVATKVPESPASIQRWIELKDDPNKEPSLRNSIRGPIDPENPDEPPPNLFIEDHPEIAAEFIRYMSEIWTPWADHERPVRKAIKFYQTLFGLRQRFENAGSGDAIEVLWGIGMSYWGELGLRVPLLMQPVEFAPTSDDLAIEIYPIERPPLLNIGALVTTRADGATKFEEDFRQWVQQDDSPVSPFHPERYRGMLDQAAARIDNSAVCVEENPGNQVTENLTITEEWCLMCRTRSADYMLEDVAQLKKTIEKNGLAAGAVAELAVPREHALPEIDCIYRGVSTPGVSSEDHCQIQDLFFPKPFNREQVQVVKNLERGYGVVLQGPPGTGKTHTIANIICHYLALGKRVLVTSKDAPALQVLRSQLPDDLKPLTAAILTQERGALREMEQGISRITAEVMNLDREEYLAQQQELTASINQAHATLAKIEKQLLQQAKRFLEPIPDHLGAFDPPVLARELAESAEKHQWFQDKLDPQIGWEPDALTRETFKSLSESRIRLGMHITQDPMLLIDPAPLPEADCFADIHGHLIDDLKLGQQAEVTDQYRLHLLKTDEECAVADEARNALALAITVFSEVNSVEWKKYFYRCLQVAESLPPHPPADALVTQIKALLAKGIELSQRAGQLISYDIEIPDAADRHGEFLNRARRAAGGGKPTNILDLGINRSLCKQLSEVRINGNSANTPNDWKLVAEHCELELLANELKKKWNNLASSVPLCSIQNSGLAIASEFAEIQSTAERFQKFGKSEWGKLLELTRKIFHRLDLPSLRESVDQPTRILEDAQSVIAIAIERFKHYQAKDSRDSWITWAKSNQNLTLADEILGFFKNTLGCANKKQEEVLSEWTALRSTAINLWKKKTDLENVSKYAKIIELQGAAQWSSAIRDNAVAEGESSDPVIPASAYDTWLWAKQNAYLSHIDQKDLLKKLNRERIDEEKKLAASYEMLAVNRTWLALRQTLDRRPQLVGALQAFVQNLTAVGAGTGKLADHYRRLARKQMQKAHEAIRCWIMPEWRVSESLPPEVGVFDLVIIDEASQSDMRALPAIMRGQKILVVGDDKQVSPSQVGVSTEIIEGLYTRFLRHLPHGDSMGVRNSIYDLAGVAFAASIVRLREHFRCVEPIINFSSHQFYGGEIKCIRVPKASERLLPCLISTRVLHGRRHDTRKVNRAEAEAIVDEIEKLVADPTFGSRTIGIISLLGNEQPREIFDILRVRLGEEVIVRHQIRAGDAAEFQGSEFDVVFLSMVASGRPPVTATRNIEQRYNVAASRARDRMYLFHSLDPAVLGKNDLRLRLLQHFSNPRVTSIAAGRDECESPFEEEIFDHLVGLGYRVLTQVPAAGKRIDLVVEDSAGRRLALECDGYVAHPPHKWLEDLSRQRILERAGWVFHRIWGPSYYRDKKGTLAELVSVLETHSIFPDGGDGLSCIQVTEHREVGPSSENSDDEELFLDESELEEASDDDLQLNDQSDLSAEWLDEEPGDGNDSAVLSFAAPSIRRESITLDIAQNAEIPVVKVGRTVEVEFLDDPDSLMRFTITEGPTIAEEGLINYSSPINSAILNHKEGEVVSARLAGVVRNIRIVKVEINPSGI